MTIIYNCLYVLGLIFLSPWIVWRVAVQKKNRRGWGEKLLGLVPIRCHATPSDYLPATPPCPLNAGARREAMPCVWIHAVSVGEVNLLTPFVDGLNDRHPQLEIVISTSTESGYDLARNRFADRLVFFCPFDFSWSIRRAIARLQPDLLLLTEMELWPNLITVAQQHDIPVALINGRISSSSYRGYRCFAWAVKQFVSKLSLAVVQTAEYAERLRSLGLPGERVHIAGNLKFDNIDHTLCDSNSQRLKLLAQIRDQEVVFLAGSTQLEEDELAISIYDQIRHDFPSLRLIVVPRHLQRVEETIKAIEALRLPYFRRSQLQPGMPPRIDRPVVVVDVIGELKDWWRCADIGFVGGSMGRRGGQNMIEPAAAGVAVSFGPHTENFSDVVDLLLSEQAAVVVRNRQELLQFVVDSINDRHAAQQMGARAQRLVHRQRGGTAETLDLTSRLLECIGSNTLSPQRAA